MSSRLLAGVLFRVHPQDHDPPHVHAYYAETVVIIEMLAGIGVRLASRRDSVIPANAKSADIRRMLKVAAMHVDELLDLWERMHG